MELRKSKKISKRIRAEVTPRACFLLESSAEAGKSFSACEDSNLLMQEMLLKTLSRHKRTIKT